MIHSFYSKYDNVFLRSLQAGDIEKLRIWRNNREETKFLRDIGYISLEMQEEWFDAYLKRDTEIVFAIIETSVLKRCVGSVSVYDIHGDIAEIGKIQIGDSEAHHMGIGKKSLVMAMKIAFELMGINQIVASVHRDNIAARTNDLKIGFKIVGEHPSSVGGMEDELSIGINELKSTNDYYSQIMIGNNYKEGN